VDFKFKKPGFDKLIIFDLDETLIHSLIERDDMEDSGGSDGDADGENGNAMDSYDFKPDVWVDLVDPDGDNTPRRHGFAIRPFALDCLK
jgi:hypothetical protein